MSNLVVGIATTGRPDLTAALVRRLVHQTRRPDQVIIGPANPEDIDDRVGDGLPFPVAIVRGPKGSSVQRNTIIQAAADADVVIFFDDDFIPAENYLERCLEIFERHPDVVVATGTLLADGIHNAGYTAEDALAFIAADTPPTEHELAETYGGYGCNMAVRMEPVRAGAVTFNEGLPLYGWLEDIDFSRRLASRGRIVRTKLCRGVHLGVKKGRTSGVRFGYSQVANPLHLTFNGHMAARFSLPMVSRNLLANIARSFAPEPWVDRRGRLKGNMLAIADLLRGNMNPQRILDLE